MTTAPILEFTAVGTPKAISGQVEESARERHSLSALVVPWESDAGRLTMAVTSMRSEGWAIEHTNIGTVTLVEIGQNRTRVVVLPVESDHPEQAGLVALLERLARDLAQTVGEPGV